MQESVFFQSEDIQFEVQDSELLRTWVKVVAKRYGFEIRQMNIIFCSDECLLKLNKEHLDHDYYTDILTFPLHHEGSKELIADIFISVDRVRDNAEGLDGNFIDELHRVIVHGLLHLVGFDDHDKADKDRMKKEEDLALSLRMF